MKNTIINHKKYTVEYVFNMVGNWHFINKFGVVHLVDGEDLSIWVEETEQEWQGIKSAIAYAKELSNSNEDGVFWWTRKYYCKPLDRFVYDEEINRFIEA